MPNIHNRIKENRKKLGMSQSDLAIKCGVSQPTVANWERGDHVPRPDALEKIAESLGVDSVWLLSGELPANRGPSFQHLSTPIRHIPVFEWVDDARAFSKANAIRYISMAIQQREIFAISGLVDFDIMPKTTLIFDRNGTLAANTRFLARDKNILRLTHASEIEGSDMVPMARLIYSIRAH
jgi:transcriptional regulator with XRE-family HTH domain